MGWAECDVVVGAEGCWMGLKSAESSLEIADTTTNIASRRTTRSQRAARGSGAAPPVPNTTYTLLPAIILIATTTVTITIDANIIRPPRATCGEGKAVLHITSRLKGSEELGHQARDAARVTGARQPGRRRKEAKKVVKPRKRSGLVAPCETTRGGCAGRRRGRSAAQPPPASPSPPRTLAGRAPGWSSVVRGPAPAATSLGPARLPPHAQRPQAPWEQDALRIQGLAISLDQARDRARAAEADLVGAQAAFLFSWGVECPLSQPVPAAAPRPPTGPATQRSALSASLPASPTRPAAARPPPAAPQAPRAGPSLPRAAAPPATSSAPAARPPSAQQEATPAGPSSLGSDERIAAILAKDAQRRARKKEVDKLRRVKKREVIRAEREVAGELRRGEALVFLSSDHQGSFNALTSMSAACAQGLATGGMVKPVAEARIQPCTPFPPHHQQQDEIPSKKQKIPANIDPPATGLNLRLPVRRWRKGTVKPSPCATRAGLSDVTGSLVDDDDLEHSWCSHGSFEVSFPRPTGEVETATVQTYLAAVTIIPLPAEQAASPADNATTAGPASGTTQLPAAASSSSSSSSGSAAKAASTAPTPTPSALARSLNINSLPFSARVSEAEKLRVARENAAHVQAAFAPEIAAAATTFTSRAARPVTPAGSSATLMRPPAARASKSGGSSLPLGSASSSSSGTSSRTTPPAATNAQAAIAQSKSLQQKTPQIPPQDEPIVIEDSDEEMDEARSGTRATVSASATANASANAKATATATPAGQPNNKRAKTTASKPAASRPKRTAPTTTAASSRPKRSTRPPRRAQATPLTLLQQQRRAAKAAGSAGPSAPTTGSSTSARRSTRNSRKAHLFLGWEA
ncbi:hypothetical protein BDZ90DRAFT_281288, partial [Jaminaea rosea]